MCCIFRKFLVILRTSSAYGSTHRKRDLESASFWNVRPCLYGEKLSPLEGLPAYPSYPGRANFSYISLQSLENRLHEKQKVSSAKRVTRLAGSPFCDGRVTLLAGQLSPI